MGLRDLVSKGRFLAETGKSALRKIGDGSRKIKTMAGQVNKATGGAAGLAFEASKSLPGIGTVTSNLERGLDMADKYSKKGINAIEMAERYANLGAKAAGGDIGAIGQLAGKVGGGKGNMAAMAASSAARMIAPPGMGNMAAGLAGKAMKSLFP